MFSSRYTHDGAFTCFQVMHLWLERDFVAGSRPREHVQGPIEPRLEERDRGNIAVDCVRACLAAIAAHTRHPPLFHPVLVAPGGAVCQSSRSYDACLVIRFTPLAIALLVGKYSSNKIQYPAGGASSSEVAPPGRARDSRICVRLIGRILSIVAEILSQSRRTACSRCGSMNPSMEGKSCA